MINSLIEEDDLEGKNVFNSKIIRGLITELLDDNIQHLKKFEFFQITGKIMNICEENCCFDFYCSNCMSNEKSKSNASSVYLDYQKLDENKHKLMFNVEKK